MYDKKSRTPVCLDEVGERKLIGPELIQIISDKVRLTRENLKISQDGRQKSYDNKRRKDLEIFQPIKFMGCYFYVQEAITWKG